ncbi:SNF2-related protein [Actinomadura fulvescens]|uniref:DEAD/DEAH box helicase n=1 Tax=Actinomadura fulvescens TaxID=46160 RepID=UPI0031D711B7
MPVKGGYDPDDRPLLNFYIPLLSHAVAYDRAVGYFNGRELALAAKGVSRFIAGGGRLRLICGANLSKADVQAVLSGKPLDEALAERLLADPFGEGVEIVERRYLEVMSYLAREGRLLIRVGVPLEADGRPLTYEESRRYFHTKYGVLTDALGNRVAFSGSNNDTEPGWFSNHESFSAFPSWLDQVWEFNGRPIVQRFADHWEGRPAEGWAILNLPEAVEARLISYTSASYIPPRLDPAEEAEQQEVEEESLNAARAELAVLASAPKANGGTGVGLLTAPVEPLPHQLRIAHRAVTSFPHGFLLADEVGLGKTIEAGLILRELMLSEKASSALLLVPASVARQWQEELQEKLALSVARYDSGVFYAPDGRELDPGGRNPWSAFPIVLASSHLARRKSRRNELLDAGPWDIVLVDEAHHARRRGGKSTGTPNTLLALLQEMRRRGLWKALYLASATPMQMHPHEAWDLISLFGLPGLWGHSAANFERYYQRLREDGRDRDWSLLQRMLADHLTSPGTVRDGVLAAQIRTRLGHAGSVFVEKLHEHGVTEAARFELTGEQIEMADTWLRRHTPMRDQVFRTTRQTLRDYQNKGILPADVTIPVRDLQDRFVGMTDEEERLYQRIEDYIRSHYNSYTGHSKKALGLVMTAYRRRLTSSFYAVRVSLQRRLTVLERKGRLAELMDDDDSAAAEALFDLDDLDSSTVKLAQEISELREFLDRLNLLSHDSKRDRLEQDISDSLKHHETLVIFTQYTDTMDYLREQLVQVYGRVACYSGRGGELYDSDTNTWTAIAKSELKELFRAGERVKILLGTDAMSEGLNLQTSGRLINYDLPWNFMRVEQRIGRIDRIGGRSVVEISNYFYKGTVEEQIYRGIARDFDWFTQIVGDAQPVLADVEQAVTEAAMAQPGAARNEVIASQIASIERRIQTASSDPVALSTIADTSIEPPPDLQPAMDLAALQEILTSNSLTGPRLRSIENRPGIWQFDLATPMHCLSFTRSPSTTATSQLVTFNRNLYDSASDDVRLLTYATPELAALLEGALASVPEPS